MCDRACSIMVICITFHLGFGIWIVIRIKTPQVYSPFSPQTPQCILPIFIQNAKSLFFISSKTPKVYSLFHPKRQKYIADSAQTEYCTTFHCSSVCSCVTGVTSHISHIYKGMNAMLIIRGPINPCTLWIKIILAIFLARTRPDKTIFSALTNLTT